MAEQTEQPIEKKSFDTEAWFAKNQKSILIVAAVVVAVAGYWYMTRSNPNSPEEVIAAESLFMAEHLFGQDSLETALNGRPGQFEGFADIAANYQGTSAGNVAQLYAGLCHLNLGRFQEAIPYLETYASDDKILGPMAKGCLGDAYWELGNPEEALAWYRKAADASENLLTTPMYLQKAAVVLEFDLNKPGEALELYKRIQKDFFYSNEGRSVEKSIARLEAAAQS